MNTAIIDITVLVFVGLTTVLTPGAQLHAQRAEALPAPMVERPAAPQPSELSTYPANAFHVRIKDITFVEGRRTNKLTGMGLVTGLNGTGGQNPVTRQFALNMLERFGLRADPQQRATIRTSGQDKTDNLSVVTVTAEIDVTTHKPGGRVDVVVSAFDDASSLQGGVLMLTPLYAVDGEVYAVASGPLSIGGFSFSGQAAGVQKNHPTTGRIPNGGTIEKAICQSPAGSHGNFRLNLTNPDLQTASRISSAINGYWSNHAKLVDSGTVEVLIPGAHQSNPQDYVALVQAIRVVPDHEARVVINERTGTITVGQNVRLSRVAITHADLAVITGEQPAVSQPAPFSQGQTAIVPRTEIEVFEGRSAVNVIDQSVSVGELARALNTLGVTPRDLSSIFQQLKSSGALHAKLEFH